MDPTQLNWWPGIEPSFLHSNVPQGRPREDSEEEIILYRSGMLHKEPNQSILATRTPLTIDALPFVPAAVQEVLLAQSLDPGHRDEYAVEYQEPMTVESTTDENKRSTMSL